MIKKSFKHILMGSAACFLLAACAANPQSGDAELRSSSIDSALDRAAASAAERSGQSHSLGYLERNYKRNSSDPLTAIEYGAKLRESDYLDRAALVLQPFADDPDSPARAKTEYAAVQLALGDNNMAEKYAQKAILQNPEDARAYHYLGIALDAEGNHKQAERAFRKGLDHWQGDPTPIMNNLALNLASQGFLDESVEILRKAKTIAPNRLEVERNLRIITALQQSHGGTAPKPPPKPEVYEQ